MNNICNIASQRKVSLTWGAKKKSKKRSLFEVGDEVIVSNHGTKWDHRAKIIKLDENGETVLVKWETTLKRKTIKLKDCRMYCVDETTS